MNPAPRRQCRLDAREKLCVAAGVMPDGTQSPARLADAGKLSFAEACDISNALMDQIDQIVALLARPAIPPGELLRLNPRLFS